MSALLDTDVALPLGTQRTFLALIRSLRWSRTAVAERVRSAMDS